jgi:glycosyltransferase involved in cell wall biosynthesis
VLSEAIFVDDDSADGSAEVLRQVSEGRPWVQVFRLSRNFGQHAATAAGIRRSGGHWVATLDEDLQHHPRFLLPLLARAVHAGADVAYAEPVGRVHRTRYRDFTSRLYKSLMSRVAGNPQARSFNSFRMIRGEIARAAAAVMRHETYLDVVLGWFTRRVVVQPFPLRDPRDESGRRSGYGLRSLLSHARRMLVSSQIKPLRLGAAVGLAAVVLSVLGAVAVFVIKFLVPEAVEVSGWTSLILAIFFFGGLTTLLVGVVLEYMTILLLDSQGRPSCFVVDRSSDAGIAEFLRDYLVD